MRTKLLQVKESDIRWNKLLMGLIAPILLLGPSCLQWVILAPVAQAKPQNNKKIQQAIEQGLRLFDEGSEKSLIDAIQQFNIALELSQTPEDRLQEATALFWLGRIHFDLGETSKSLEFFHRALPIYRVRGGYLHVAMTLNNIGRAYHGLSDSENAIAYYTKALARLYPIRIQLGGIAE
jgi:tetratricopeptide (TPR) repeat protein